MTRCSLYADRGYLSARFSILSHIGNSAPPILTGAGTVRVSSISRGASSSYGIRATSNPVRRLRRGDFQGNPGESAKFDVAAQAIKVLPQAQAAELTFVGILRHAITGPNTFKSPVQAVLYAGKQPVTTFEVPAVCSQYQQ
jgi:hypothetical protein